MSQLQSEYGAHSGCSKKSCKVSKPFDGAFVAFIRMMIAPVIFCVVVQCIATMTDREKIGCVGIVKSMSACRALTEVIRNGAATIVVSRWERELDSGKLRKAMARLVGSSETKSA